MSKKPFNWSMLDRQNLYSMLYRLKSSVVGKRLIVRDLQKLLSTHIKKHLPIRVIMEEDSTHEKGIIYVGGMYYAYHDLDDKTHIQVSFSYQSKDSTIRLSERKWDRICSLFADTVLHEIIHMRQYRSRGFKEIPGYLSTAHYARDRKEQEYYGHKDEMGAFAFNIACELYEKFNGNFDLAKRYLDSNLAKRSKKLCWHKFLRAFNWDHNHPIVRSMKKKIIRNLPYAEIGKPFKTSDYLTY